MIELQRPRRLRQSANFRSIAKETEIITNKLMLPLFVTDGSKVNKPHPKLPGCVTYSLDELKVFLKSTKDLGVKSYLLFGVSEKRDENGSEALNSDSPVCKAIQEIREMTPEAIVCTDVALDPYTSHGHDGLYKDREVLNDETVDVLCKMSVLHAEKGAQLIGPSDMMDGRVQAIRQSLDESNFLNVGIMSYTAKYASSLYGPFRDTLSSEVKGDKKTYQMDPANRREAIRELDLDIAEGADIIMVKPAVHYLDIISDFSERSDRPVAAYHVSGEAAMLEAGAAAGLFDRRRAIEETSISIFRAGADIIASYFTLDLVRWSNGGSTLK